MTVLFVAPWWIFFGRVLAFVVLLVNGLTLLERFLFAASDPVFADVVTNFEFVDFVRIVFYDGFLLPKLL